MNMNKCVIRKTRKELKKYLPQKKNETEVEKQKRIKRGLYFYEINYKNRIYYVLDVFEYDITHFNPNGNYTYLLKGFTFLNEAITAYHLKEPEIYQRVQKIRMLIKNILTTKDSRKILPRNHKLLKKIIGKLEVFSLSYANNLDDKYTENKTELFYYLIFSIKDIETLYSFIHSKPHMLNFLDKRAYELLLKAVDAYLTALQHHIKKSLNAFDDVIYFDKVLKILFSIKENHLSIGDYRDLEARFATALDEISKDHPDYERYSYFIHKWRLYLLKGIKAKLNLEQDYKVPEEVLEELYYKYQIRPDFSKSITLEAETMSLKNEHNHHAKNLTHIYTVDTDGALELDDGFSCIKDKDIYHLGIHIANPMHYLSLESPIFKEAAKRTTTIYIRPEVITMYPEVLAKDLFSLNEGTIRQVISLYADINKEENRLIKLEFKLEEVYVAKNDSYTHCNKVLRETKNNTAYAETLRNITEIIPFLSRFYKIDAVYAYINRTNLNVSQTNIIGSTPSEKMVEALMLFMNHMTSKIALQEEIPFIYRNHVLEKNHQEELENYLRQIGNQNDSQYYINEINIQKNKYPQSYYSIDNKGHKGLGMSSYAHMTSPIRRLADNYNILMIQECFLKKCSDPHKYHYALLLKQASDIINHQRTTLEMFTRDYYLTRKK